MSTVLRGPQPPFIGAVYLSARSTTGPVWEVVATLPPQGSRREHVWRLNATSKAGELCEWRTAEQLRDRKKWRFIGVTAAALPREDGTT